MMYSDIPSAQTLVLYFKSRGIKNIVISPGSRNAPLTLGFTKNPYFTCYSIVDERSAGFFALGMAQKLGQPVALVCTSGSAVLNYYPAVAEAFYSNIPLIVVSADRPAHKIDIGDGQTIRQPNIFEKHIGYSANLKEDVSRSSETAGEDQELIQEHNVAEINKALGKSFDCKSPVHINIPFEEPLYGMVDSVKIQLPECLEDKSDKTIALEWTELIKKWNSSSRKMILIGVNSPDVLDNKILEELAKDDGILVFTETTSNVYHPNFFGSIDSIIAPIERSSTREELFAALQPDLLISVGGLIVSKKIKAFLRKYQPKHHWHIDPIKAYDTFFCLSNHIRVHPNLFFSEMLKHQKSISGNYRTTWNAVKTGYELRRQDYLKQIQFSDFKVFDVILGEIPDGYQLHLANSSTVRYAQLFSIDPTVKVYCNRGTSGIDGSTSTAVGASIYHKEPTLLITGDLSFFYDANGLWNTYVRPDFRIILINNSGGGIFRILPGFEETAEFSTFFETSHGYTAKQLSQMHHFEYLEVKDEMELEGALQEFYKASQAPKLMEICTPRELNNKILLDYFDFIS